MIEPRRIGEERWVRQHVDLCDDDADEEDRSPNDMPAHVNGLARRKITEALTMLPETSRLQEPVS